jgi:signal transduction histidine kinase
VSTTRSVLRPLADPASQRLLAYLASALVLGPLWLALLITGWSLTFGLALTPLVLVMLLVFPLAVRAAAKLEVALQRGLLGAELETAPWLGRGGLWRPWRAFGEGSFWRAQAYLGLRATVGQLLAVALVALVAGGVFLLAAPTFYWAFPAGFGPAGYRVDTLPEALALSPLGAALLVAGFWMLAPLSAPWRTLGRALLDRGPAPAQASSTTASAAGASGDRRPLLIHAAASAGLELVLIAIWLLTSPGGYFWPVWPLLVLSAALAIHAVVVEADRHQAFWLRRRLDSGFAIHAGVWAVVLLFFICVWAVTSPGGYFWPIWPMLVAPIALVPHALALLLRSPDRAALERRIASLETSRAGAVDVQEAELRRIERDLHDGAQARLVALGMSLGLAEQKLASDADAARELLAEARAGAGEALRELRDLARGIHPPVLADRGLDAAVRALATGSPISVTVSATLPSRPSPAVESAAYFVVAEALANAGKHAQASRVDVRIARHGPRLAVEIHDDGRGGADPDGSGLSGLRSRVQALDGTLTVTSPRGGPTTIRAELPCKW